MRGVGFRPFIYRASELGLVGWVNNSSQGVFVEVEGRLACVEEFVARIRTENPPRSSVQSLETSWLDAAGYTAFEIRPSSACGPKTALVLPDIATCADCVREIFDPLRMMLVRKLNAPLTSSAGRLFDAVASLIASRQRSAFEGQAAMARVRS